MIEDISNNCIRKVGNIKVENICAVVFFFLINFLLPVLYK